MFKNIYFYRARLFPALITSIPMLIFINKFLVVKYSDAFSNIYDVLPLLAHFGLSAAIIFLCVQINRLIAKEIFQRLYYREELFMPTTTHMLLSNDFYDSAIKSKIRNKIQDTFDIILPGVQEEQHDSVRTRKIIAAAVSQIRIALKGNTMLLQHNIEYGFWRNLIGGSVLAVVFSILIYFFGRQNGWSGLATIGVLCFIIYLLPVLLSKLIIKRFGLYYSKILYEQFLSL